MQFAKGNDHGTFSGVRMDKEPAWANGGLNEFATMEQYVVEAYRDSSLSKVMQIYSDERL